MVANCRGSNACLAHGVTDLVEPDYDIAGREKSRNIGLEVIVDENAAIIADRSAAGFGKARPDDGSKSRIDGVERHPSFSGIERDTSAIDSVIAAGSGNASDTRLVQRGLALLRQVVITFW